MRSLFAVQATVLVPSLPGAIWNQPFILVIGITCLAIALMFALTVGAAAAAVGGWSARRSPTTGAA